MYSFLRKIYWILKKIYGRVMGTKIFEKKWEQRGISEIQKGFSNITHPHRAWLMSELRDLGEFKSILEVGCGYGPNVITLAKSFPGIEITGIDINPISIQEGKRKLSEEGISLVELRAQRGDDYSDFSDKSVDIVLTDALLLYFAPDKIRKVIQEMKRISRKAIVLLELHKKDTGNDAYGDGELSVDGWIRDYQKLLLNFFNENQISLKKIPIEVWKEGRWPIYGHMIIAFCDGK